MATLYPVVHGTRPLDDVQNEGQGFHLFDGSREADVRHGGVGEKNLHVVPPLQLTGDRPQGHVAELEKPVLPRGVESKVDRPHVEATGSLVVDGLRAGRNAPRLAVRLHVHTSADQRGFHATVIGIGHHVELRARHPHRRATRLHDEWQGLVLSHLKIGFPRDGRTDSQLQQEALDIANQSDIIIAVMGEAAEMSGESTSRVDLNIPDAQKDLLKKLVGTGKPVVLVLFTGRPLTLVWEDENVPAILNVWFPGTEAGNAVADVLFGDVNPSGKLTATFPRSVGQVPISYSYKHTGRAPSKEKPSEKYRTGYIDETYEPLYPFGYGLSYTQFEYGELSLDKEVINNTEFLTASITVTNKGEVDGKEIVQLYLRDVVGSVTRPLKELKGYEKIYLKAGESKTVRFRITPEMLKFYNYNIEYVYEPGEFDVMVGCNSRDVQTKRFTLR